ncbi:MAG TPA: stage III sporulation protein AC [Symbiobacteriaceae bacterium]|nr:stage III sporulation protein AC [Symbiobacteriaceae bacterium]
MEIYDLLKIAGIGIIVSLVGSLLSQAGRKEQESLFTLMGFMIVMMMVVGLMTKFFAAVQTFAR